MTRATLFLLGVSGVVAASVIACDLHDADLEEGSLQLFAMAPDTSTVSVFEVGVSGQAELTYLAEAAATVEIFVGGESVYVESFAAATYTLAFSATVPLSRTGPNEIEAKIRYHGHELTVTETVIVEPPAPTVLFPTWTAAFDQTDGITVTAPAGWTVDLVEFSRDGELWAPAPLDAGDDYTVALTNLDIGDNELAVRVHTSNLGHTQTHLFFDTVAGINAVFDCNAPSSMLPSTELLRQNKIETRTLVGYFGDPDGGHTLMFEIQFDDQGDTLTTVASAVSYGRTSILADFNVDKADCGDPCTQPYRLRVFVDDSATPLCTNDTFGIIREF